MSLVINYTFAFSACPIGAPTVILLLNRTQVKELLGMLNLNAIRTVVVCIFCLYVLAENGIVKHLLVKPFFVKVMRIFWALMLAAFLFFCCVGLLTIFDYAQKVLSSGGLHLSELSKLIPHFCIIVLTLFCWRHFWYYFRNDEDTIVSGWYIKRHIDLNKRRKFEESYRCLQEASEIKPDSLQIWCLLASFAQLFLENAEQADQYLANARRILDSKPSKNPKEIAVVEHYSGYILRHRNDRKTGLEHMKKAYELGAKRKWSAALLCIVFCGIVLVLICAKVMQPPPSIIYDALDQLIDKERTIMVDLTDVTDFDWNNLYAFPPYTGEDEVSSVLGEKFVKIKKKHPYELSSGDVLVVFVHNDKVVYYEFVAPKYRLFGADGSFVIPREKAVFKVKPYLGRGPYELHEIDSQ